jgi:DNA-binding HxlR family transcriptional regulator
MCPVSVAVKLIGNKWRLQIIWQLLEGEKRFGELRKNIPGISQKVLTDNLRMLEKDDMIVRTVYAEVPSRVEYKMSDLGKSMVPVLTKIEDWSVGYMKKHYKHFTTCRGVSY